MKPTGKIHAGSVHGDTHEAALFALLVERGWRGATGREIREALDTHAVSATAAGLRSQRFKVPCRREGSSLNGKPIFRYWLTLRDRREHDRRVRSSRAVAS